MGTQQTKKRYCGVPIFACADGTPVIPPRPDRETVAIRRCRAGIDRCFCEAIRMGDISGLDGRELQKAVLRQVEEMATILSYRGRER